MGWLAAIGAFLLSTGAAVASAVMTAISWAGTALAYLATAAVAGVEAAATYAGVTLADVAGTVIGAITPLLEEAAPQSQGNRYGVPYYGGNTVGSSGVSALDIIARTLKDFADYANSLNRVIVNDFVRPITDTVAVVNGLTAAIHGDLAQGLLGMARIPGEVAAAFTGEAAIVNLAAHQTQLVNVGLAQHVYLPSFPDIAGTGLDKITKAIQSYNELPEIHYTPIKRIDLANPPNYNEGMEAAENFLAELKSSKHWWGEFGLILTHLLNFLPIWGLNIETATEEGRQAIKTAQPLGLLNPEQLAQGLLRDELSKEQAYKEALKSGIDPTRLDLITGISRDLIDIHDLVTLIHRNLISWDLYASLAGQHGLTPVQIQAFYEVGNYLPTAAEAITWQARGVLSIDNRNGILRRNGWAQDQIDIVSKGILSPANPDLYAAMSGRMSARDRGYLGEDLRSSAPAELNELSAKNLLTEEQSQLNWLGHWMDMSANDWISAFFRGVTDRQTLDLALTAHNVPTALVDTMIEVERELIPIWLVPEILESGVITDSESTKMLGQLGVSADNIEIIQKFVTAKIKGPLGAHTRALQQLSLSNLRAMYLDGILDSNDYQTGLIEHGYAVISAELLVRIEQLKKSIATRKQSATDIVDEINVGLITSLDGVQKLYNLGLSEGEIARFKAKIRRVKVKRSKLPSQAELNKMFSAGIIDDNTWTKTMVLLGYSDLWVNNLLKLLKLRE